MRKLKGMAGITISIFLIGICLTLLSLFYVRPTCNSFCMKEPCAVGSCKTGEQKAGFPFPFIQDATTVGSSPIPGWGRVGDGEDFLSPDIKAFWSNVFFYSAIALIIVLITSAFRVKRGDRDRRRHDLD